MWPTFGRRLASRWPRNVLADRYNCYSGQQSCSDWLHAVQGRVGQRLGRDSDRQSKAQAIVAQSFPVQAHVGQHWSWRAKGFRVRARKRCVFKSEKSGREIQEIWPKKIWLENSKNPAPGARGSKRFRGPGVPKDSGGPGFQSSRGHAGVPEVPGGPGFRDDRLYYSMCEVSVLICKMFLFICKMVFGVMCKMWPLR